MKKPLDIVSALCEDLEPVDIDEITVPATDIKVTALVYRKWYNPMRYWKGKQVENKVVVEFVTKDHTWHGDNLFDKI